MYIYISVQVLIDCIHVWSEEEILYIVFPIKGCGVGVLMVGYMCSLSVNRATRAVRTYWTIMTIISCGLVGLLTALFSR